MSRDGATSVWAVLNATVTGSACESHVLQARVDTLPPLVHTLLLDAGDDDAELIAVCAQRGIRVLAPLSKPIGKSTLQDGWNWAAYLSQQARQAWVVPLPPGAILLP